MAWEAVNQAANDQFYSLTYEYLHNVDAFYQKTLLKWTMLTVIQPLTLQIRTCLNEDNTLYSVNCFNKNFQYIKELEVASFKRPSYHVFFLF